MSVLGLLLALAQPAGGDFLAVEWGSTPEQVEEDTDGIARVTRADLPKPGSDKRVGNKGKWKREKLQFKLKYEYDSTGLVSVRAETKFRNCKAALTEMDRRFGQPVKIHDQVILTTIVWEHIESDSRIAALVSQAGICNFNIHRLSTFEPDAKD